MTWEVSREIHFEFVQYRIIFCTLQKKYKSVYLKNKTTEQTFLNDS